MHDELFICVYNLIIIILIIKIKMKGFSRAERMSRNRLMERNRETWRFDHLLSFPTPEAHVRIFTLPVWTALSRICVCACARAQQFPSTAARAQRRWPHPVLPYHFHSASSITMDQTPKLKCLINF